MEHFAVEHPVIDGDYVVPTIATEAASEFVCEVVRTRLPGCMVVGKQRFGKSRSIRQTKADLLEAFGPKLVIVGIQVEFTEDKPKESWHYTFCLDSIGHVLAEGGSPNDLKRRFQEAVVKQVAESGQRRVVLIYDDAQFLWEHQFGYMMNDFNFFEKKGIKATYVLVGQEELVLRRKNFLLAKRQQLVGRFMVRTHIFHGVRNVEDMQACLESFDVNTEFPTGSGISYTQHFFPKAFEKGWTLRNMAARIFKVYRKLQRDHSISPKREIPMQYFIPVVEGILTELGNHEVLEPAISEQWIEDKIVACGYVGAETTPS